MRQVDLIDLPAGAAPNEGLRLLEMNPKDKFDRNKGLNPEERSEFSGICRIGADQIIKCYRFEDKRMIAGEIFLRCHKCPYAFTQRFARIFDSNLYPRFVDNIEPLEWENPKCFVYFITDGEYVKIGVADDVKNRLRELQVGNPKSLYILCSFPLRSRRSAFDLERRLHYEYDDFRRNGEWFHLHNYLKIQEFLDYSYHDEKGNKKA